MKTSLKVTLVVAAVAIVTGLTCAWPYVKMDFAESARYTEQDQREYKFFTPELLKNMPRVTDDYDFGYANVSGPGLLIYELKINGTTDTSKIDAYLGKLRYKKSNTCDIQGDCWRGPDPKLSVSVGTVKNPDTMIISVVKEP